MPQLWAYVSQGGERWRPKPPETTVEYRLAKWLNDHHPQGRVFASGGLRFRLNSWFEIAQVGGGFETGLQNRMPVELAYRIRTAREFRPGREAEDTLLELKALGAEYVVVHGPKSQEYYRDFQHLERLANLPVAYREGDDTIYALPPPPLAHFVTAEELPGEEAPVHPWVLEKYVAAQANGLQTRWTDASTLVLDGPPAQGKMIAVRVNADPGWKGAGITRDHLGFMVLHPPAGPVHVELHYRGTAEQRIMAGLSLAGWVAALGLLIARRS